MFNFYLSKFFFKLYFKKSVVNNIAYIFEITKIQFICKFLIFTMYILVFMLFT